MTVQEFWEWLVARGLTHRVHVEGFSGRPLVDNAYLLRRQPDGWSVSYVERGLVGVMKQALSEEEAVAFTKAALDRASREAKVNPPGPADGIGAPTVTGSNSWSV